jgi:DNA polymerase III alpha subunit
MTVLFDMPDISIGTDDLIELMYQEKAGLLTTHEPSLLDEYNKGCENLGIDRQFKSNNYPTTVEEALLKWSMPEEYHNIDLEQYFATKVHTNEQINRVITELDMFKKHNMETMLKFMIYLVDIMKENNIVWGVGRGSSVSCYLLFLVGLHSVDSIKYKLDMKEFFK